MRQDLALYVRLDLQELSEFWLAKVSDAILIEAKQLKLIAHLLISSPNFNFHGVQLEVLRVLSDLDNVQLGCIILPHHRLVEYLEKVNVALVISLDNQSIQVLILG